MSSALSQPTLDLQASPSVCDGRKFTQVDQAVLWSLLQQDPYCTSRDLLAKAAQHRIWPRVSLRRCLKSLMLGNPSYHQVSHGDVNHRLAALREELIILVQSSVFVQPTVCTTN